MKMTNCLKKAIDKQDLQLMMLKFLKKNAMFHSLSQTVES